MRFTIRRTHCDTGISNLKLKLLTSSISDRIPVQLIVETGVMIRQNIILNKLFCLFSMEKPIHWNIVFAQAGSSLSEKFSTSISIRCSHFVSKFLKGPGAKRVSLRGWMAEGHLVFGESFFRKKHVHFQR